MAWIGLVVAGALIMVVGVGVTVALLFAGRAEEKGPMPKNHGGFGQRVTGGKS